MDRREAEGLSPGARVLERDLQEETRRFELVAQAIESIIPRVEVVEPGLAFVPVGGAVRYYGDESTVVGRLREALDAVRVDPTGWERTIVGDGRIGVGARIGVAAGPFAARWAASVAPDGGHHLVDDDATFLASLPVDVLEASDIVAVFRWLGIGTLGDLARLPRSMVASRFGSPGLALHRLASGEDRPPAPRPISEGIVVEERFDPPLEGLDQVGFAARALAARLIDRLARDAIAPHRIEVEVESGEGTVRTRVWRSADPFTERMLTDRVWWQLRAWVESTGIPGGLARVRIVPEDLSDRGRQVSFLEDTAAVDEAERSLVRTQAILGPDAVLAGRPQGGRTPAERVLWHRWGEPAPEPTRDPTAPWPGRVPEPSPALVPDGPVGPPVHVEWEDGIPVRIRLGSRWEPILSWAGPWRSTGRWWRGEGGVDRYQLVTSAGAFLYEVDGESGRMVGIYD